MPDYFRVIDGPINIRIAPNLTAHKSTIQLRDGDVIESLGDTPVSNDGFLWIHHALGWSAAHTIDGKSVFMKKIDETSKAERGLGATNPVIGNSIILQAGKSISRTQIFHSHPVAIEVTKWVQYFGNTQFAYNLKFFLNRRMNQQYFYCQSLHGGLDYGNDNENISIFAGIGGVGQVKAIQKNVEVYKPNNIRVQFGDFTIIYGHIGNIPNSLQVGSNVTERTKLGEIESTQNHLHLEVRYQDKWIINPLLLMSESLSGVFITKFSSYARKFYRDENWSEWQTPFDQPVLRLSGKLIGPRAEKG